MENDPLATYLEALARDDCYRVEKVLKAAPYETTEVVSFVGANEAALGPFVRKRLNGDVPLGAAYRVLWEAQRAGRRHRHLPRIYDVHESDGDLVVVMEYVAGRTLRDEVYERDASLALALRLFPLLCDGASELHEEVAPPLIHRDLKPTNVIVSEANLTIIDFGIARSFREGAESDTAHFGTRSYAPPEQFGYGQTDVRSDVYALGMILYYLVTERDPSPAVAANGFAEPDVPPCLRPVLQRACAFDPSARFPSARALKEAFSAAVVRAPVAPVQPRMPVAPAPPRMPAAPVPPPISAEPAFAAVRERQGLYGVSAGIVPAPPSPSVPDGRWARRVRSGFSSLGGTEIAGLVWDGALFFLWVFFMIAALQMPFSPGEEYREWPLGLLMVLFWGFAVPFFSGAALLIADWRVARRMFPALQGHPVRWRLVAGGGLMAIGVLVVWITSAAALAMGFPY